MTVQIENLQLTDMHKFPMILSNKANFRSNLTLIPIIIARQSMYNNFENYTKK